MRVSFDYHVSLTKLLSMASWRHGAALLQGLFLCELDIVPVSRIYMIEAVVRHSHAMVHVIHINAIGLVCAPCRPLSCNS